MLAWFRVVFLRKIFDLISINGYVRLAEVTRQNVWRGFSREGLVLASHSGFGTMLHDVSLHSGLVDTLSITNCFEGFRYREYSQAHDDKITSERLF